jgi:hypothetical protein
MLSTFFKLNISAILVPPCIQQFDGTLKKSGVNRSRNKAAGQTIAAKSTNENIGMIIF